MDEPHRKSAARARESIERGTHEAAAFRAELLRVPYTERDAWVDLVLGLGELPPDDPALPRGCVPYLPCPVDALVRAVDEAEIREHDTFVDIGGGVGRAAALVQLLTGASAVCLEIQPQLVAATRALASRLHLARLTCVQGEATKLLASVEAGSVFFLYCPFGDERLAVTLGQLKALARKRALRICCVDLPLPALDWLEPQGPLSEDLVVYRSPARP